jgi:hypothetical protein
MAAGLRPQALERPPWERSVLDDVAAKRPWNLRVKWARLRALRRLDDLDEGVTVIIVNWNTKDVTADVIRAVQDLSPPEVRVLVVDNGSTDGSRQMLHSWPGIDTLLLRSNAGHGVALDLAVCSARTSVVLTLDSDAIPLRRGWLEPAVAPVRDGGDVIAGLRSRRGFVHPVYSAVNTAAFIQRRLSFQTFLLPGVTSQTAVWGENAWDTAELLTARLTADEVAFVESTPNLVPGLPGMSVGGVVYHHGGVSRATTGEVDPASFARWTSACSLLAEAVARTEDTHG